jgi:hypothetical protein
MIIDFSVSVLLFVHQNIDTIKFPKYLSDTDLHGFIVESVSGKLVCAQSRDSEIGRAHLINCSRAKGPR